MERWLSGRKQQVANLSYLHRYPGFESLSLRHLLFVFLFLFTTPALAIDKEVEFLNQYTTVEFNGKWCNKLDDYDAVYLPLANKIDLCIDTIHRDYPSYEVENRILNSLLHEAVHLAQDCKAGIENKKMTVLNNKLVDTIPQKVYTLYKKAHYGIETEAWYYWGTSTPLNLVSKYCKKK